MPADDISSLVKRIQGLQRGRHFAPYIDYVVFPRYRQIAPHQRVDFEFPLTVLVGRNGTGKSSVLQALYGAPDGMNVNNFWFGTAVDPVERVDVVEGEPVGGGGKRKLAQEQKAAFWYGYKEGSVDRQAVKQRVRRDKAKEFEDQENWEPGRPIESYGMTPIPREGKKRGRHPQVKMKVKYLNLRYHLSAFDRCFHFWSIRGQKRFQESRGWKSAAGQSRPKVQDYIRFKAIPLNETFTGGKAFFYGNNKFAESPERLSDSTLVLVSRIVGKSYKAGLIVTHRLYDDAWADSVRFATSSGEYTEANAGSGETAVVKIVRLFEGAEKNSLLLLDEPETSLHPGAQRELLRYILEQVAAKHLQVVISTHAPALVNDLPQNAIKVLRRQGDGPVLIDQALSADEAFYEIGHPFDPKCNIIVEDRLAKLLLDEVAKTKGDGFAAKVRVEYRPGGESEMKKDVAVFMHGGHRPLFVFDGDCRPAAGHTNPKSLRMDEHTADHLDAVIKAQTGQQIKFHMDAGMSGDAKAALRSSYLTYFLERVFYLPFPTPEEAVWDDAAGRALLAVVLADPSKVESAAAGIAAVADYKSKFDSLSKVIGHGSLHPSAVHAMFVAKFVEARGAGFDAVSKLLDQVVSAAGAGAADA